MSSRRLTTFTSGRLGLGALGFALAVGAVPGCGGSGSAPSTATALAQETVDTKSSLVVLAEGIGRSEETSLAALVNRLAENVDGKPKPIADDEAAEWITIASSLRNGFLKFQGANGRAAAVNCVSTIFDRFSAQPCPAAWEPMLDPSRDLLATAINDASPDVRAAALGAIGKIWHWYPGRTMLPVEEHKLAGWKDRFHPEVVRKLADRDPRTRAAAILCLSYIPIDALAAPAVAYVDDARSGEVRHQVLVAFAGRRNLLTEDMIIKRLHDTEPGLAQLAEIVLKGRGLSADQIALGRLITSPKPEMRASVIPLLKEHPDLDPVVWLLKLSHDADEMVRSKVVEAMTGRTDPEILSRLREMATSDASNSIRSMAGKLVAGSKPTETTVALPPLPGSPSLSPRAN